MCVTVSYSCCSQWTLVEWAPVSLADLVWVSGSWCGKRRREDDGSQSISVAAQSWSPRRILAAWRKYNVWYVLCVMCDVWWVMCDIMCDVWYYVWCVICAVCDVWYVMCDVWYVICVMCDVCDVWWWITCCGSWRDTTTPSRRRDHSIGHK